MNKKIYVPNIGVVTEDSGFLFLDINSDRRFKVGVNGVTAIVATGDRKVEFIAFDSHTLAYVTSSMGYDAYYPVPYVELQKPVKAVLMDLDGTSVRSEEFWIWIIQLSLASLLDNLKFELQDSDLPYVSGHSVSEHLAYCIEKYCPEKTVEEARTYYFEHTRREMNKIMEGRGRKDAFTPTEGLKDFLYELKRKDIKIGLVTSGLYEKAWPEILSAFKTLEMGDPKEFYDAIISAGYPLQKGSPGTLGELSPKPHPWLYSETGRVGLGINYTERHSVIGIEDSGAGICSIRIAGYTALGMSGGNIIQSGTKGLCNHYCNNFNEVLNIINE